MKELKFAFDFGHPVDAWDSVIIRLLNEAKHLNALTSVAAKVKAMTMAINTTVAIAMAIAMNYAMAMAIETA